VTVPWLELSGLSLDPDPLVPALAAGRTDVGVIQVDFVQLAPEPVRSQAGVAVGMSLHGVLEFDAVAGGTRVRIADDVGLGPDPAAGAAGVTVDVVSQGVRWFTFDPVAGEGGVRVVHYPDLSRNAPILLGFSATMRLESVEPLVST
jgi:hypothetical protein